MKLTTMYGLLFEEKSIIFKIFSDYIDQIYETMVAESSANTLEEHKNTLRDMTPAPLSSSFEFKETHADAIQKRDERKKKIVHDVPPTNPGNDIVHHK